MTGTELVNILKSPTSKIVIFGTLLIIGTLVLLPILTRNDDPDSIVQETELRQEEKAPLDIDSNIPRFKLDRDSESADTSSEPPPPFFYFPEKFSPPQNGEFFESQKEEHFHFSKNSPGETGTSFCLKKEFEHRENGRKKIRTSDLYS